MRSDFEHPNAQPFSLGGGEDACLLIHGFTGSPGHMRPLGEYLAERGFAVRGISLPGHASRIEDMNGPDWRAWLTCAREAADDLKKGHRHVYAAGLSMGGVLSLLLGEEKKADAVVSLASPMRIYAARDAFLSRLIWPFVPYVPDKTFASEGFLDEYDFGYDATPVRRVKDLTRLMRMAERGLGDLHCPLLIVQSHADGTVRPVSADILYARAASKRKELLMLERSPHVVTLGIEREEVFRRAGDFLARCAGEPG